MGLNLSMDRRSFLQIAGSTLFSSALYLDLPNNSDHSRVPNVDDLFVNEAVSNGWSIWRNENLGIGTMVHNSIDVSITTIDNLSCLYALGLLSNKSGGYFDMTILPKVFKGLCSSLPLNNDYLATQFAKYSDLADSSNYVPQGYSFDSAPGVGVFSEIPNLILSEDADTYSEILHMASAITMYSEQDPDFLIKNIVRDCETLVNLPMAQNKYNSRLLLSKFSRVQKALQKSGVDITDTIYAPNISKIIQDFLTSQNARGVLDPVILLSRLSYYLSENITYSTSIRYISEQPTNFSSQDLSSTQNAIASDVWSRVYSGKVAHSYTLPMSEALSQELFVCGHYSGLTASFAEKVMGIPSNVMYFQDLAGSAHALPVFYINGLLHISDPTWGDKAMPFEDHYAFNNKKWFPIDYVHPDISRWANWLPSSIIFSYYKSLLKH